MFVGVNIRWKRFKFKIKIKCHCASNFINYPQIRFAVISHNLHNINQFSYNLCNVNVTLFSFYTYDPVSYANRKNWAHEPHDHNKEKSSYRDKFI